MDFLQTVLDANTLPDYKDNAEAYELEERSRPDEMLMINIAADKVNKLLEKIHNAKILDLCCGTGLSMEGFIEHPNISKIVGVDISKEYLACARNKFSKISTPHIFINDDAVTTDLPVHEWDIIMLASAYHHIEDDRKLVFLRKVHGLLKDTGRAIFAENILPEYDINNRKSYQNAVKCS